MTRWWAIPAIWLLANLAHALVISCRRRLWERDRRRDAAGRLLDAAPFDCGQGEIAVLCVHGFADVPSTFRPLCRRLTQNGGIRCRAMRLPGTGEYAQRPCTLEQWLDAIHNEATALRRSHRQVWIAGHSMGGALAIATAIRNPECCDGLLLLSPLLRVSRARSPLLPPHVWFNVARVALPFSRQFESGFSGDVDMQTCEHAYQRDRFVHFATYRNLFALVNWLRPRAAQIPAQPLFARLAGDDRVVDSRFAMQWLSTSPATPRDIAVAPDASHALQIEPEWEQVTDAMRSFILGSCR